MLVLLRTWVRTAVRREARTTVAGRAAAQETATIWQAFSVMLTVMHKTIGRANGVWGVFRQNKGVPRAGGTPHSPLKAPGDLLESPSPSSTSGGSLITSLHARQPSEPQGPTLVFGV